MVFFGCTVLSCVCYSFVWGMRLAFLAYNCLEEVEEDEVKGVWAKRGEERGMCVHTFVPFFEFGYRRV